jgi:TolB-like protein/Tfp pilus assembly protein PilF
MDPENEYFSDGISEEILNALSKVNGLQVCSRTSSFAFKGQQQDVRQIGQKLGVGAVLEGSVRRGGNKVRIGAQLVDATNGYQLWTETFDGTLDDIFIVQDEIAAKIVDRLKEKFSSGQTNPKHPETTPRPAHAITENVEAYNLYLKGRFHWNKSNPDDIKKAITAFEAAIRIDPGFAAAYCMLSHCYSFMGSTGAMPYAEAFGKAKDLTLQAIEQDPSHAESHLSLASIKFLQNWDFAGAEISLKKARALGLNSSLLNEIEGTLLIALGRFVDAVEKIEDALKQEPLSLSLMCMLADAYAFAGRFEDAIAQYDKAIEMDPNFRRAFEGKGLTYLAMRNLDLAIENLNRYQKLIGHPLKGQATLGHAYALAGRMDEARECLEKTVQREKENPGINLNLEYAFLYAGFGEYDRAVSHFVKIYEQRTNVVCIGMIYCIRFPILKELKSKTQFKELLTKMGLD